MYVFICVCISVCMFGMFGMFDMFGMFGMYVWNKAGNQIQLELNLNLFPLSGYPLFATY